MFDWLKKAFEPPPPTLCPNCEDEEMWYVGQVAGAWGFGSANITSSMHQCPECKMVKIG